MDLGTLLGICAGIAAPTIGAIYAYGKLNERVKDHAEEITDLRERVKKAETAAIQVQGLGTSIEHLGERFADQIKHLVDTFAIETGHTRAQLSDIKEELRFVRGKSGGRAAG